jgi:hypothetical protein
MNNKLPYFMFIRFFPPARISFTLLRKQTLLAGLPKMNFPKAFSSGKRTPPSAIPHDFNYASDFPVIEAQERDHVGDLFRHINKNKILPDFFATLSPDNDKVKKLLKAISQGKARAKIFQDENCYLYLLYIIKTKQIDFWEGMSVYGYLLGLTQFASAKDFYTPTLKNRSKRPFTVIKIIRRGNLTPEGYQYLQQVWQRLINYDNSITLDDLIAHAHTLAPAEQWALKISNMRIGRQRQYEWDLLAELLTRDMPFLPYQDKQGKREFLVPSMSLMNYFMRLLAADKPVRMMPTFGILSDQTNLSYLKDNVHPVAIYAKAVKHNLLKAGGRYCGVFFVWLHDVGHTFWASLLAQRERHLVLHDYIALISELKLRAQQANDKYAAEKLDELAKKAADFELVPPESFYSADRRFDIFTSYLLGDDRRHGAIYRHLFQGFKNHVGDLSEDRILYLLLTKYNEESTSVALKQLIKILLFHIYERDLESVRNLERIATITTLGNGTTAAPSKVLRSIRWDVWYEMIHDIGATSLELEVLWAAITDDSELEKEFMILVNDYNIRLFPYYLKPAGPNLKDLKNLLAEKANKPLIDEDHIVHEYVKPPQGLPASPFFSRRSEMPGFIAELTRFLHREHHLEKPEELVKFAKFITKIENHNTWLLEAPAHHKLLVDSYLALAEACGIHFHGIELLCYQHASKLSPERKDIQLQLEGTKYEFGANHKEEVELHTFSTRLKSK